MGFLTDLVAGTQTCAGRAARSITTRWPRPPRPRAAGPRPRLDARVATRPADGVAVIAEVKRASPSAGAIALDADPARQATRVRRGGARRPSRCSPSPRTSAASLDDLARGAGRRGASRSCGRTSWSIPTQVLEARAAGADAVLLIAACLPDDELAGDARGARALGMEPLVETHSDADLDAGPRDRRRGDRGERARPGDARGRRAGGARAARADRRRPDRGLGERHPRPAPTSRRPWRPARLPSWWARR